VRDALQLPSRGLPHRASSPRGENPGRFRGALLHRSPPRPSIARLTPHHRDPRGPYDPGANAFELSLEWIRSHDPPDLDADFPVTSRSVRFGDQAESPLLGFSKDRPSIVHSREVRFRVNRRFASPRTAAPPGNGLPPAPRSAHVVSHHLSGLILPGSAGLFHPAADPGVHSVSPRRETRIPAVLFLPFEAFPPLKAFTEALAGGRVRGVPSLLPHLSAEPSLQASSVTALLALPSFPPHDVRNRFLDPLHQGFPWLSHGAATSGPCSFNGSVAPVTVSSLQSPVLPWA